MNRLGEDGLVKGDVGVKVVNERKLRKSFDKKSVCGTK